MTPIALPPDPEWSEEEAQFFAEVDALPSGVGAKEVSVAIDQLVAPFARREAAMWRRVADAIIASFGDTR